MPASLSQAEHLSSPSSGDEHVSPDSVWIETKIVVSSVTEALRSTHERFKSAVEKSSKCPEMIGHRLLSYRARRAKAAMGTKLIKTVQSESVRKLKAALRSASKRTKPRGSPTEHVQQKRQIAAVSVSEEEQESPPARPNKKTKYCCFVNCPNTTLDKSLTFTSVPTQLPPTRTHKLGMKQRELFWIRKRRFMRSETLRRAGLGSSDKRKDLRFCSAHTMTEGNFPVSIRYFDKQGQEKTTTKTCRFTFPDPMGPSAFGQPAQTENKGKGTDCQLFCTLTEANQKEEQDNNTWHMETQRLVEKTVEDGANSNNTSRRVLNAANLIEENAANDDGKKRTVVDPCKITAKEVKRRSGFEDLESLLAYVTLICNGDINMMCIRTTSLTWFEEWMMYAEYIWGRTGTRWADLASSYCVSNRTVRRCLEKKKQLVLQCRSRWPMFASQEEDTALRDDHWNHRYDNR
mmetsp:Transcript_12681/g.23022  ORF Transcript_12681/g.23022 Transcript_12681/m.23022 type:complete len:461 (-) Transcript_12681:68-1450(-)